MRTGVGGHAAIQFPDGSYVRMAPSTEVKVTAAQLSHDGNLQSASLQQKVGRTFTNVQHLVSGATFQVGGHSVSASVRGTQFEVLVRADNTNLIKVFDGTVRVTGATTITLTAGQQVEADAGGRLSGQGPIKSEPQDPYAQSAQCARAVSSGTTAGTTQTSSGDNLTNGQSAEVDYYSPGGTVSVALCYPGSLMTVTVIDPNGTPHTSRQGTPPVQLNLNGPSGLYKAMIRGVSLPPEGEPFSVSFATATQCGGESVDTPNFVRQTISNQQISEALRQSGVTLQIQGTSANSARVSYYSDLGKVPIAWTILFYAATPNLGFVLTQFSVRGVNVTTGIVSRLSSVTGSAQALPTEFIVERVYSCNGSGGGQMVVEGHH